MSLLSQKPAPVFPKSALAWAKPALEHQNRHLKIAKDERDQNKHLTVFAWRDLHATLGAAEVGDFLYVQSCNHVHLLVGV